jgi:hypothetical protein
MALSANEQWKGGFVVDTATGYLIVTSSQSGAAMSGGYLRDPDGRLVVVTT